MELGSVPARQTTYLGHPFFYPHDSAIGQSIAGGRDWDPVLRTIIPELVRKDEPVIWEVGSNIGASLYQIMCAKPRARVLAFEPSRRFRPFLERNVELAGFDHVEVLPLFVGREGGQQRWLYGSGTTAGVVEDPSKVLGAPPGYEPRGREFVRTTTLDEVRRGRSPIDFLKVDTDGVELDVLRGGAEVLEQDRPVLFFELTPGLAELIPTPLGDDLTWLHGLGYRRLVCFSPTGAVVGATDDPEQALAWAHDNVYCDVLTCFRGSAARARLAGIERAL
jgi:FkbM family methyltransferase